VRAITWSVLICAVCAACAGLSSPTPTTGLTGTVLRGPVTPVCRTDVPCDAPFSASFVVLSRGRQVTQFESDATGHFTVWIAPGTYEIAPRSDAPVISPATQIKTVDVGDSGLTTVTLTFDTGIR
jgi:hypothetical protein